MLLNCRFALRARYDHAIVMSRWALRILVFLLLGAIVNVVVAWGIGIFKDPRPFGGVRKTGGAEKGPHYSAWLVQRDERPEAVRVISRWDSTTKGGFFTGSPDSPGEPLLPSWAPELSPELTQAVSRDYYTIGWEYGWPTRSLGGVVVGRSPRPQGRWDMEVDYHSAVALDPDLLGDPNDHFDVRLLVFRPIWPGFAINTVFYAAILWLLFAGPFVLRRLRGGRRIRRGLCPKCAYDLRGRPEGTACPECGAMVTP